VGPFASPRTDSARPDWTLANLTVLLTGIRSATSRAQAERQTVDAISEALDAEIVVLLRNGEIQASTGFGTNAVDAASLWTATSHRHSSMHMSDIGTCALLSADVEGHSDLRVLVARLGDEPFMANEAALLDGMCGVLGLMLNLLDQVSSERQVRNRTEALLEITNAIARREPHDALQRLITRRTKELLRTDSVVMRAVDPDKPGQRTRVARAEGLTAAEMAAFDNFDGLGGMAIGAERIVETYGDDLGWVRNIFPDLTAAIASPIFVDGVVKGSLGAMTFEPGRRFTADEKSLLQALAELSSIVFTDAHTVQAVVAARHDLLTGLPGRGLILDQLALAITADLTRQIAVMFLDLGKFKPVNDRFGHEVGDAVLRILSGRMKSLAERYPSGAVGRIGGDEFVAFLDVGTSQNLHDGGDDEQFAIQLIDEICRPIPVTVGPRVIEVTVGVSLGIATSTPTSTAAELLSQSDAAMYQSKATGGNRWRRFVELSNSVAAGS
jgi:diguanylate cyclase (GGDEF)-like protein